MPELKVIVMPPERGVKRPAKAWRHTGRDTVASRVTRDRMVAHTVAFAATVAGCTALWLGICTVVDVIVKVVG